MGKDHAVVWTLANDDIARCSGKLPLFLKEVGFAVQELLPRYKGVQFLLATKHAEAQVGGRHEKGDGAR
jgi:hypothetical protein